jgi:hypothetical protein
MIHDYLNNNKVEAFRGSSAGRLITIHLTGKTESLNHDPDFSSNHKDLESK